MRSVFASLLAVSLIMHSVLGCCWHHAHDPVDADLSIAVAEKSECGHDHGNAPERHPSHDPGHSHRHCQGLCNYLPAQKSQNGKSQSLAAIDFAAVGAAKCHLPLAGSLCLERARDRSGEPPLRLHLLHQIMLI